MIHYAALDAYGNVLGLSDDVEEATSIAKRLAPGTTIQVQSIDPEPTRNAKIDARDMPDLALKQTGLPRIDERRAMGMSRSAAHERLLPFFDGLLKRGEEVANYETPRGMAKAWIGQNYKTSKEHPESPPAQVMGLTLVPARHAREAAEGQGSYAHLWIPGDKDDKARAKELAGEERVMLKRWKDETPDLSQKFTLCAGASNDCRQSCLVFAGQNASERYNTYRKVAQTLALLREPEAFMRMLVESIDLWLESRMITKGDDANDMEEYGYPLGPREPYFRLNVLSDVPWEMVSPWLFERFARLQFYDYTKVPGRETPGNYDLTFSLSGEPANLEWAHEEIHERERRIAVVFVGHKLVGGSWEQMSLKGEEAVAQIPLPRQFWGLPVIDGDVSDVRPRDDLCCVGLRWKTPSGKRAGGTIDLQRSSFVTPVYIVDAERPSQFAAQVGGGREIPRWRGGSRPSRSEEQWLIAATTPRQQPIAQPMTQAPE